jgi:hypothetical protein
MQQSAISGVLTQAKKLSQNALKLSQKGVKTVTTDPKRVDYGRRKGEM